MKKMQNKNLTLDFSKKKFQNKLMYSKFTGEIKNKINSIPKNNKQNRLKTQRKRNISVNKIFPQEINLKIRNRRRPNNKNIQTLEGFKNVPRNARSLDLQNKGLT